MPSQIVFLMYHELEQAGRALAQNEPGYVRYVVSASDFQSQMQWLSTAGLRGASVSEALAFPEKSTTALTFDDGAATDLLVAAPILQRMGFNATFYITLGFLNSPGFLSNSQLRELAQQGFEIGSHSLTHPYLSDLDDAALEREIRDSKMQLEDLLGQQVIHFSCPGGRYDARVQSVARHFGYRTVSTSHPYANSAVSDPYALGRVVIMRDTSLTAFQRICRNQALWRLRTQVMVRSLARRVLGNSSYDSLRTALLGGQPRTKQSDH
jgi:peptidoglycan/xylan/chitin deacetylase (PgdA/CDA1 family)